MRSRPDIIEKCRVAQSTPEYLENQSRKLKENWTKQEYRDKQKATKSTPEYLEKMSALFSDFCYVSHPIETNGEFIKIQNLNRFCRDNNLNQGNMWSVAKGDSSHHKQWKCRGADADGNIVNFEYVKPVKEKHIFSEETRKKMSDSKKGKPGHPVTDETKEKIKISVTKIWADRKLELVEKELK